MSYILRGRKNQMTRKHWAPGSLLKVVGELSSSCPIKTAGFGSQVPLSTPTPYPVSLTRLTPMGASLAIHVGLLSMRPCGEEAAIWLLLLDRPAFQNWFYHLLFLWSWASHSI